MLFLPMLQQKMNLVKIKPLHGAIVKIEDSTFTVESYLKEDYQQQKEKYLNSEFGFRSWFIRINNQIAFDLYNVAKANGVIIGKENYLYEDGYIKSYTGENFIGKLQIENNVRKLKQIRDTLKSKNIDLIIVFAAGKASFYPEFIPAEFLKKKTITNYEYYLSQVKQAGFNYIDFNKYFIENKHRSKYPLYPKTGIHWSVYGMAIVADSINSYIAKLRNINAPDMYWNNVICSDSLSEGDKDIEEGTNLLFSISNCKMGYPELVFKEEGKQKARVLTIADSYYWGIYGSGIAGKLFEKPEFWFYFKEANILGEPTRVISAINIQQEIEKQDVVILMATEASLSKFPWGFIEKADEIYFNPELKKQRLDKIEQYKHTIRETKEWLESIRQKAILTKISLDSMITLDAIYMVDVDEKK